jgi:hypothetical protein
MNHNFLASQLNQAKCGHRYSPTSVCGREIDDHTDKATCESCGNSGNCDFYCGDTRILLCEDCLEKERNSSIERGGVKLAEIDSAKTLIEEAKKLDYSIHDWTQVFNARPVSIAELRFKIEHDTTIENKHFALAKALDERFKHLSSVLGLVNQKQKELSKQHQEIQLHYNELSKKLKEEEKKEISLKDVNYKPIELTKKKKAPTIKKYDAQRIKLAAAESGIPASLIQMTCVARNIEPVEAVRLLKSQGM